ncbi:hypothetical protein AB6G21_10350 [Providencia hangzhouensis]
MTLSQNGRIISPSESAGGPFCD